ncbi:Helicase ATP-binding domain-containing protein [Aphelenchoides besseyi]|nr:Helicase ATP-binding domain-containing protein [Aphelenchoides besseyi]KAI6210904.1 Helicase ATP-binding domain-containing protein [Aphelenchoides besseyi]
MTATKPRSILVGNNHEDNRIEFRGYKFLPLLTHPPAIPKFLCCNGVHQNPNGHSNRSNVLSNIRTASSKTQVLQSHSTVNPLLPSQPSCVMTLGRPLPLKAVATQQPTQRLDAVPAKRPRVEIVKPTQTTLTQYYPSAGTSFNSTLDVQKNPSVSFSTQRPSILRQPSTDRKSPTRGLVVVDETMQIEDEEAKALQIADQHGKFKIFQQNDIREFDNDSKLDANLRVKMYEVLRNTFGFQSFRFCQKSIVIASLLGHDCCVVMPTGAGKSLCYQLPSFITGGVTVVI